MNNIVIGSTGQGHFVRGPHGVIHLTYTELKQDEVLDRAWFNLRQKAGMRYVTVESVPMKKVKREYAELLNQLTSKMIVKTLTTSVLRDEKPEDAQPADGEDAIVQSFNDQVLGKTDSPSFVVHHKSTYDSLLNYGCEQGWTLPIVRVTVDEHDKYRLYYSVTFMYREYR